MEIMKGQYLKYDCIVLTVKAKKNLSIKCEPLPLKKILLPIGQKDVGQRRSQGSYSNAEKEKKF